MPRREGPPTHATSDASAPSRVGAADAAATPPVHSPSAAASARADGNGYVDFGQDDWDDAEYSGDEEEMRKRAKGEGGEARKKGVFNNLAPKKKKVRACCCVRLRACCLRPHVHAPPNHLTLHPSLTRTGDRARERHVPRRGP